MGYLSQMHGHITINAVGDAIDRLPEVVPYLDELPNLTAQWTDGDTSLCATAEDDEPARWYTIEDDLGYLAHQFPPHSHTYHGHLVRIGEDQGDVEKYWIENTTGIVKSVRAELRWPDGSPVGEVG